MKEQKVQTNLLETRQTYGLQPTSDGLHPTVVAMAFNLRATAQRVLVKQAKNESFLLGAKGIATRSKDATNGALLALLVVARFATRGSSHRY